MIRLRDYAFHNPALRKQRRSIVWVPQVSWVPSQVNLISLESYGAVRFLVPMSVTVPLVFDQVIASFLNELTEYVPTDYVTIAPADPAVGLIFGTLFEALGFTEAPIQWLRFDRSIDHTTGERAGRGTYKPSIMDLSFEIDDTGVGKPLAEGVL